MLLVESDGVVVVADGLVVVSFPGIGVSAIVVDWGIIRLKPDCFSGVGDGLVVLLDGIVSAPPTGIDLSEIRLKPDCFGVVTNRSLELVFSRFFEAPIKIRAC
jgi:hypothetical protein